MELDDAGAELAVAGTGYGAGRPEVGGGDQGTPAKEGARSCRPTQARQGTHYLWAQLRRASAPGWVHHRVGGSSADVRTGGRANNCTGNCNSALTTAGDEWIAAVSSASGV